MTMTEPRSSPKQPSAVDSRGLYLEQALGQVARLLSLQDRNPFSPSYGSFHRAYWLDKVSDFPDAMAQIGTLCLALVYTHAMPGNPPTYAACPMGWQVAHCTSLPAASTG